MRAISGSPLVEIYVFASNSLSNVKKGVDAGKWAIPTPRDNMPLEEKASRMLPGSKGILYAIGHGLVAPFVVISAPDAMARETNVWPGEWAYPFAIKPLGSNLFNPISKSEIPVFLKDSIPHGKWSDTLHIQGRLVFIPSFITEQDWARLLKRLGDRD